MNPIVIAIALLLICFLIRMPISLSMFSVAIAYFLMRGMDAGQVLTIAMSRLSSSSNLVAIPLFIFTANIMNSGRVTEHMFTFSKAVIGKRKGARTCSCSAAR